MERVTIEVPADVAARLRQESDAGEFVAQAVRAWVTSERTRTLLAGYTDLSDGLIRRELRAPIVAGGPQAAPDAVPAAEVALAPVVELRPATACDCEPLSPVQLAARVAQPVPVNVPLCHPVPPAAPAPPPAAPPALPAGAACACGCLGGRRAARDRPALPHVTGLPAAAGSSAVPAIAGERLTPAVRVRPVGALPPV
jgi:hypothetical protein